MKSLWNSYFIDILGGENIRKPEREDNVIGKTYDIEYIGNKIQLETLSMSPKDIKQSCVRKHKNVTLMNINGWGVGQAHFLTEDDEYLLLPWCYIISMIPSRKENNST